MDSDRLSAIKRLAAFAAIFSVLSLFVAVFLSAYESESEETEDSPPSSVRLEVSPSEGKSEDHLAVVFDASCGSYRGAGATAAESEAAAVAARPKDVEPLPENCSCSTGVRAEGGVVRSWATRRCRGSDGEPEFRVFGDRP